MAPDPATGWQKLGLELAHCSSQGLIRGWPTSATGNDQAYLFSVYCSVTTNWA